MEITIYKIVGCSYCVKIDELMQRANVEYKSFIVGRDITKEQFLEKYPLASGYPFVVIDGVVVGGLVETVKYFVEKGLVSSKKNDKK